MLTTVRENIVTALEALCDYALYKSTFTLHYIIAFKMLKILISYNLLITKLFGNVFLERLWLPPMKRHFLHGCFCNCYVQMASQRQTFHKCCWSPVYSSHITFVVCLPCMLMLPLCFVGLFLSISVITVTVVFKQGPQRVWWESATAS